MKYYVFRKRSVFKTIYIQEFEFLRTTIDLYEAAEVEERYLDYIDLDYLSRLGYEPVDIESIPYFSRLKQLKRRLFTPPNKKYRPQKDSGPYVFSPTGGFHIPVQHVQSVDYHRPDGRK